MSAETDDRVIIIVNYRLNIFIAGEPHVELRTHNFELSVEIVGWLEICVSNLSQNLFVVVDHVSPGDFQRGAASATRSNSPKWASIPWGTTARPGQGRVTPA